MEELLKKDREAGVPEPPDPAYTVAVLKRKLGHPTRQTRGDEVDRHLLIGAVSTMAGSALVALLLGASPWWLLAVPVSALILGPILLRKG
ncbi:MAG TPA: hypothetical protein VNT26_07555, partial [Candidatus Sulfotelmatobacter sp.]|nr:hypothetical protein [Candidatus Sulfotelmatobacter sp.]